jgi:hypothetical protein
VVKFSSISEQFWSFWTAKCRRWQIKLIQFRIKGRKKIQRWLLENQCNLLFATAVSVFRFWKRSDFAEAARRGPTARGSVRQKTGNTKEKGKVTKSGKTFKTKN